jgi:hypothetical protein
MQITDLQLYFGEVPFLMIVGTATYLAFERWRFPDLSIESSFFAGTIIAYLLCEKPAFYPWLLFCCIFLPFLLVYLNWILYCFRFPTLLSGLLILWIGGTLNFFINGSTNTQTGLWADTLLGSLGLGKLWASPELSSSFKVFILSFFFSSLVLFLVWILGHRPWEKRLLIARHVSNTSSLRASRVKGAGLLLCGMLIYSYIAFAGGIATGFVESVSTIGFMAAISPGICIMFYIRFLREYSSLPEKRPSSKINPIFRYLRAKTDSLGFVLINIFLMSLVLSLIRHLARILSSNMTPGVLNAATAFLTILVWAIIAGAARLSGKLVSSTSVLQ